jgi:hypothetical protein
MEIIWNSIFMPENCELLEHGDKNPEETMIQKA